MAYKNIEDILESNEHIIEFGEYHILINSKLQDIIYDFVEDMKMKDEDAKEFIKNELRDILELKESDIILLKQEHIFIKISNDKKEQGKDNSCTIASDRRFNGIDEDELGDFYSEYFSKKENAIFFKAVVKKFVEKYFLSQKIDNINYEKKVFSYLQAIIVEQLIKEFDCSSEFVKGFSGYIFRINFNYVFENIADFILKEISQASEYMVEFLKYYSLNIVIVNGVKYTVPLMLSDEGLQWNVISMLSIAKIYTRTKLLIKELRIETQTLDKQILELYVHGHTPVEYNNAFIKEKQKFEKELSTNAYKLKKVLELTQITKDEERQKTYRQEIIDIKLDIEDINIDIENLASKELAKSAIDNYIRLEKNLDAKVRDLKAHEKILAQNAKSFLSIKSALVKALIAKKQRL